jgi:hypothetical protein
MVLKTTFTVGTTEVTLEAAANYASPACFNFTKTEEGFCFLTLKGFTGTFKLRTLDAGIRPSTAADQATNGEEQQQEQGNSDAAYESETDDE